MDAEAGLRDLTIDGLLVENDELRLENAEVWKSLIALRMNLESGICKLREGMAGVEAVLAHAESMRDRLDAMERNRN